jgi:hypothetical protein
MDEPRWVFQPGWPGFGGPPGVVRARVDAKASGESDAGLEKVVTMLLRVVEWTHDRRIANTRDGKPV